ncbi:MAG: YqiA/YcfP family alpha/beta fold hydrolase [Oceanococcaceae bacterium]
MQPYALLYLHGLGSSGQSDTGRFLAQHFGSDGIVACPDYRPQFFAESVRRIDELLTELRRHAATIAVLGSSMGGWQALHALARHADITLLALNPVIDPAALRAAPRTDDVDQRSGAPLPWPEIVPENFPPAPCADLDPNRLRLLIGAQDDVVPPDRALAQCARFGWSHRVFADWGHRAELGAAMREEVTALLQRARSPQ